MYTNLFFLPSTMNLTFCSMSVLTEIQAGACWAQTEDPSGCGAASLSQGRWDPDSLRSSGRPSNRLGMQPWALSLPDKELCLREALAVCTPPSPEPSAKRPGS